MRPLKLTVDGFACFKEYQEIDFTGLDLFAISGPTGAGKSSILDAMVFALYGKVPRLQSSLQDLISLGRDKLAVTLEFTASGRRWFVSRSLRRGRSAEAMLEEMGVTAARTSGGIKEVNLRVQQLLGLPYEAFIQAVLLPQGQFAQFLKNVPAKRREILRELLRLNVYERMRELAQSRKTELATQLRALNDRLGQDHSDSTDENLVALRAQADQAGVGAEAARVAMDAAEKSSAELKRRHDISLEFQRLKSQLEQFTQVQAEVEKEGQRLEHARRASAVAPLLDQRDATRGKQSDAERQLARVTLESAEEAQARSLIESSAATALERADALPRMEARLHALDEVKGVLETRGRLSVRLKEARQVLAASAAKADGVKRSELRKQEAEQGALAALNGVMALEQALPATAGWEDMESVRQALQRVRQCQELYQRAQEQRTRAAQRLSDAASARDTADTARRNAAEMHAAAQLELQKMEHAHLAHRLVKELKTGELCPVCGHNVDAIPKKAREKGEQARLEAAAEKAENSRKQRDSNETGWLKADAAWLEVRSTLEGLETAAREAGAQQAAAVEELQRAAGTSGVAEVASRLTDWDGAREQRQRLEKARQEADKALAQAVMDRTLAQLETQQALGAVDVAEKEVERIQRELADADERIGRVSTHPDPTQERAQLAADIRGVRETLRRHQQELAEADARRASVDARLHDATRRAVEHREDLAALTTRLTAACAEAGFSSETEAGASILSAAEQARLDARVKQHRTAFEGARHRLAQLEAQLDGAPVDESQWLAEQRALEAVRRQHQQLLQDRAVLLSRALQLEARVAQAANLRRERDEVTAHHALHETLALDLRNDRLQAFLLQEAFAQLVAGASLRLFELTGRYTFDLKDDEFVVLDHDNAQERRSADTLSGGETFLASLALALELSDQVQRAAGATALDSLFIDEGFATLDGETLDVAAAAVECLPTGGRMVGIITHLPALTERLPARILVEKRTEGSRIHVVR